MAMSIDVSPSLALSVLVPLCALIMVLVHRESVRRTSKKKLPPGELGLPWIGETIEFYKSQQKNRLYEEFVQPRVARHGKIFKTRLMGSPTVVVNGAEANRFFMSNEFKLVISSWPSSSVQLMGENSIMEKQGEAHRLLRGVISATLGPAGLEAIVPEVCKSVKLHLEKHWRSSETISLYRSTKVLTFTIVFECLLGIVVEPGMLEMFERVLEGVFAPAISFPGSKFSRAKSARMEIQKMLVDIVRRKREEMERRPESEQEEGMLLSQLVAGLIKGEISEEEVVDNVVLLVFAAHDTTSFAIATTFKMLAQHPNCYSILLQEHENIMSNKRHGETLTLDDMKKMKYTWQVARESMRLFPPIFGSFRKAVSDIEYEGFTIPRGWKILWTAYGTHFNEEYFPEPMEFNPSRFDAPIQPYAYLPFGGGPRLCAGHQLAKINILIFVHYVVMQYDWSLLNPNEPVIMDPLPIPSQGMPVRISPKLN